MDNSNKCALCIVGLTFALLEIFIVTGEILGWVRYNLDLESFLFIIFLSFIAFYENKNQINKNGGKKI